LPESIDKKDASAGNPLTERVSCVSEAWLEGAGVVVLSADEHAALVEYTRVTFKAENMERLNLYLAGHRDCFAYRKRIGLFI
jgi:hypothetical protein